MGSNELLITELILKNVLTVLQPAEIAALLSALIFQQRTEYQPQLTPNLTNACKIMSDVHAELEQRSE
ncbi:PREDICTED: putative ATP-dependent RNA helicase C550.03c, partial [Wasmannia auropunctata]|uniref:putative ATP-dependent RNA helicase C550.03c n=1 Tax=Wasmannia auropunctata TaxID=64793 RepID=UPI0005EDA8FC